MSDYQRVMFVLLGMDCIALLALGWLLWAWLARPVLRDLLDSLDESKEITP